MIHTTQTRRLRPLATTASCSSWGPRVTMIALLFCLVYLPMMIRLMICVVLACFKKPTPPPWVQLCLIRAPFSVDCRKRVELGDVVTEGHLGDSKSGVRCQKHVACVSCGFWCIQAPQKWFTLGWYIEAWLVAHASVFDPNRP